MFFLAATRKVDVFQNRSRCGGNVYDFLPTAKLQECYEHRHVCLF